MDSLTQEKVRPLSLNDLGVAPSEATLESFFSDAEEESGVETLPESHPLLVRVRSALDMGFAGVILAGPPGTGKSWYAKRLAHTIAGHSDAVRIVQFHASYQYEDFMLGFAPSDEGGFHLQKKTFALICDDAAEEPAVQHVLLIDEISRCDVARVFGEAMTYIETDKRGHEFTVASGGKMTVPPNLIILATMNPWDKGVDELDIALERRLAQIDVLPSRLELRRLLEAQGAREDIINRVERVFDAIQREQNEMVRLGHAYFLNCVSEEGARLAWELRLKHFFQKACRLDKATFERIEQIWFREFPPLAETAAPPEAGPGSENERESGPEPANGAEPNSTVTTEA
ncbi:5-methylcytosine-specific restriction protein B [Limimaricola soesokkakensis]|uniref:5-methylcytosine-specific restriction enzyme B n=1 Tax=Limimaricola soesokkakensis TaxID=1343159 RepID=A0A1X6Z912_9RHOB|nr:AAA family ATPase [Limimaricola soesokkakensis]PSK86582.1 5-methylcytosine-specific restriction protein B [Limimaricola soesokkakensis]SLN43862.1 5-methylcytosine-specific restriction enzyme B [Limimaricola soesokkakensis]